MKGSFTLILVLLFLASCGQKNNISGDSLGRYSYQVFTIELKKAVMDFGTCFFIKRNDGLYLITARHIFIHCDSITNKQKYPYDIAQVYIPNSPQQMVPIPLNKPSDTCSCLSEEKDADLTVIKMDNSLIPYVNSVEDFIAPPFKKLGDAEIYGQGLKADSQAIYFTDPHRIHIPSNTFEIIQRVGNIETKIIDSINYHFLSKTIKIGRWLKGFSGAPVFLQEYKTNKWRLAGVFVAAQIFVQGKKESNDLIALMPDNIISVIDSNKHGLR
ncbi:MAG: hypothetical protein M0Q26_15090 [Chitinophagaceae bacterium]|nr:hypothetical protein [Chitinophagaceae bacterium]